VVAYAATARNPAFVLPQRLSLSPGHQTPAGDPDLEPGFPVQTFETGGGNYTLAPPPPPPPPPGAWQLLPPLPRSLFGPATTPDGRYVYAIGGYHFPENIGSTLNTVYRYDPAANRWAT